jgi:ribosomal protein S2
MITNKKKLLKNYLSILNFNVLLEQKGISKNFYTLILKNKLKMLNIIKIINYLKFLINFLNSQYKKENNFLFVVSKLHHSLFKFYQSRFYFSYISNKWSGGTLTNFITIKKQIDIFNQYNIDSTYTKKEKNILENKKKKFIRAFEGLSGIKTLPNIVIFLGNDINIMAIKECLNLGIIPITISKINKNSFISPYTIPINQNSELFLEFFLDKIFN